MKLGDKIKLINTTETGIIVGLGKGDQVEVALEGWNSSQIFSKNDLKLIDKPTDYQHKVTNTPLANNYERGIFLAFLPKKQITAEVLEFIVINNTDWDMPFSITLDKTRLRTGFMAGFLKSGEYQKHHEYLQIEEFDIWKNLTFSGIYHSKNAFEPKPLLYIQKKFQAAAFFMNMKKAPLIGNEGYIFQIDEIKLSVKPNEIIEKMYETSVKTNPTNFIKPAVVYDLHIENITKNYKQLGSAEIFAMQIDHFEKLLDKAIAGGSNEVIFIHGNGNWKLKIAIDSILEFHKNVHNFELANEQKFGTGATLVIIK